MSAPSLIELRAAVDRARGNYAAAKLVVASARQRMMHVCSRASQNDYRTQLCREGEAHQAYLRALETWFDAFAAQEVRT